MTANQISYWQYVEEKRHNTAMEKETNRHNTATETLDKGKIYVSAYDVQSNVEYRDAMTQTGFFNAWTNYMQAQASQANALVNATNAASNRMNAQTNRINAETEQYKARNAYQLGLMDIINQQNKLNIDMYSAMNQNAFNQGRLSLESQSMYMENAIREGNLAETIRNNLRTYELNEDKLSFEKEKYESDRLMRAGEDLMKVATSLADLSKIFALGW